MNAETMPEVNAIFIKEIDNIKVSGIWDLQKFESNFLVLVMSNSVNLIVL